MTATLTDADALLRAICEAPDDDAPRLIYADWLDEHGEAERAEFIRVQVELAKDPRRCTADCLTCGFGPCRWCKLRRRATDLQSVNAIKWFSIPGLSACSVWDHSPRIRLFPDGSDSDYVIGGDSSRGFVSSIRLTMADLIQHGPAIVAAQPIERIEVSDRTPHRGRFDPEAHTEHRGKEYWIWGLQSELLTASNLIPWDILQYIERPLNPYHCQFLIESSAVAALSAAALAWCRAKAGLGERAPAERVDG